MKTFLVATFAVLVGIVGLWLLNSVRTGIISGKLCHSDSTSVVKKSTRPLRFWLIATIQLCIAALLLFYAFNALLGLASSAPT